MGSADNSFLTSSASSEPRISAAATLETLFNLVSNVIGTASTTLELKLSIAWIAETSGRQDDCPGRNRWVSQIGKDKEISSFDLGRHTRIGLGLKLLRKVGLRGFALEGAVSKMKFTVIDQSRSDANSDLELMVTQISLPQLLFPAEFLARQTVFERKKIEDHNAHQLLDLIVGSSKMKHPLSL